MTRAHSRYWVVLLLACMLLLGMGLSPVLAQDSTATPDPTSASTPEATSTPEAQATPEATSAPEGPTAPEATPALAGVTGTPGAEATPTPEPVTIDLASTLQNLTWQEGIRILLTLLLIVLAVIYGSRLVYHVLRRLAKRSATTLDDVLLEALRPQIRWLIAAIGFQIATHRLSFLSDSWQNLLEITYFLLYWFVVTATFWRALDVAIQWYIEKKGTDIDVNLRDQLLPLAGRLGHIVLGILAIGVVLAYFGVQLLAATAALGLGGFAISLAAKDTITNIISGIVIMFDTPFTIGDRIDVPALGSWGDVVDIGIRSTRVVTRDNRLVIIPNAAVVDSQVVNYSLPDPSYRLQVDLDIAYNGNIPWITKVLEDTIRGVEGVLADKPVNVLFTGCGDAGMSFRVRWWVSSPADKRSVTHRVCAAIQDVTVEKSIELPNKTYSLVNTIKISSEDAAMLANVPVAAEAEQGH